MSILRSTFTLRFATFALAGLFIMFLLTIFIVPQGAWADCNTDRQEALSLVRAIKPAQAANQQDKAQAATNKLSQLMERMSAQNCDAHILQVYQVMQREGVQAN